MNVGSKKVSIEIINDIIEKIYSVRRVMGSWFYKKEQEIDFAQIEDIESIKELILHNCVVANFSYITSAKDLKSIALVDCNITSEDLSCLKGLGKLKKIALNVMRLDNISCLTQIASLQELSLRKIEGIDYEELGQFDKLQSLSIKETKIVSFDFIKKMKKLTVLEVDKVPVSNLNFLYDLPKLKEFNMPYRVEDEKALECIEHMKSLQRFQYPVADISIYRNCPKIKSIGIDSSQSQNFDVLAGKDTIDDVMFYYIDSEKQFEEQVEEISKYLDLSSYGCVGKKF